MRVPAAQCSRSRPRSGAVRRWKDALVDDVQMAESLRDEGERLFRRRQYEEAAAAYEDVATRFRDAPDPALRQQVASALAFRAMTLHELHRPDAELAVWDELLNRFGDDGDPAIRSELTTALINRGVLLGSLGRSEEQFADFREARARACDDPEPSVTVAIALNNLSIALGEADRLEEAAEVCDEIVARFDDIREPRWLYPPYVADALLRKAVAMGRLDRPDEECAAYQGVVARFNDDTEEDIREAVEAARARLAMLGEPSN
jgi:tetratricopeptide (TPR) repeat protein